MFSFLNRKKTRGDMWLFVGLGNPGDKYTKNRHNICFITIDAIADEHGFKPFKAKFQGEMSEGRINDEKVVLLKPQTFMNESGQSVQRAATFFKIPPKRVVVFHDELDLAPLKMRVKFGGGVAGHNGLKSIKAHLKTPDFKRVRIGIGHPGDKSRVSGYVLNDFSKAEAPDFEDLNRALARRAELLLTADDELYMTKVSEDLPKK
jgi:PTH1 family peptidyl-tRNA hydrolase